MELIASADNNWGIGREGQLLYRVPEDMRRFKQLTWGHTVVMGRATALSLPRQQPLPGRENIVLSRDSSFAPEGFIVLRDEQQLMEHLANSDRRAFLIGGASLYQQLLPHCDKAHITRFFAAGEADRWLPDLDAHPDWRLAATSATYVYQGLKYAFYTYVTR